MYQVARFTDGPFAVSSEVQRKLTTILAADAVGYSRLMEADEVRVYDKLHAARAVFAKLIERHNGRIANTAGDGLIAEFPSVVEAVQCAIEVQRELEDQRRGPAEPLRFRIGIHLGDVIVDGDDLIGEGVNLAARLETMAEPGGILISQQVYDQVHAKLSVGFDYLGEKRPKNYSEDVPVYRISKGNSKGWSGFRRKATAKTPSDSRFGKTSAVVADLRGSAQRNVKLAGIVAIALFAIDLLTGPQFWAHWPALFLGAWVALSATPLIVIDRTGRFIVRALVVVCTLVLVNLFSWSGSLWAHWPAGALIIGYLLWRAVLSRS